MADQVFIFHDTTDNFRAFRFDGTAETSENWSPGFNTISGAAADHARIVVLDTSVSPAVARFFDADQTRQADRDITMNSSDVYSGIALADTHLVAINRTANKLEYYNLATKAYDSTRDATLPSRTSPEYFSGICRHENFLYLLTHNDSTFSPRIYKRNLDGSAVSDWAGQSATTALTMFATNDRLNAVRKNGGHWDRFDFDGTADTVINTAGSGLWAASYTTFESTAPPPIPAVTGQLLSYTPAIAIEIEGVDVTDRRIPRDGLTVGKSLDYPELLTFRSSGVQFNLDNADGDFDYNNASNFFVTQGLPAHGRGAKVLVKMGLSKNDLMPVFAGEISEVVTSLSNTKALIKTRDLSVRSRQKVIENFGIEITRRITDFEGASLDYTAENPVFYFPIWGLPISRNSVRLTVHQGDTDAGVNIVESIATEGVLSNRNAEIDYQRGLIRFEAPPADGADTQITATWKRDYRYKRPDFLVRQVLKNTGIQNRIGITDEIDARFAIEQALIRHPSERVFSSHGRPYFEKHGIVRWQMLDNSGDTPEWWMAQDNRLVKYDEFQDEYTEIAETPADDTIEQAPPGGYGTQTSETQNVTNWEIRTENRYYQIYTARDRHNRTTNRLKIDAYDLDGNLINDESFLSEPFIRLNYLDFARRADTAQNTIAVRSAAVHGGHIYILVTYVSRWSRYSRSGQPGSNTNTSLSATVVDVYNLETGERDTTKRFSPAGFTERRLGTLSNSPLSDAYGLSVGPNGVYILKRESGIKIQTFQAGNNALESEFTIPNATSAPDLTVRSDYIFVLANRSHDNQTGFYIRAFTFTGTEATHLQFSPAFANNVFSLVKMAVINNRMYLNRFLTTGSGIYTLYQALSYSNFSIYQFDTTDFEDFYCLVSNTSRADITRDTNFNRNAVMKYDKSANSWSTVLDTTTGQPQIAHVKDGVTSRVVAGDNQKHFAVIDRNSKRLIFYRRVNAGGSRAAVSYINETDNVLTDIYSEAYSTNDGLPYSMDFVLDERTDGIYVYTFVVKYSFSGTNFSSATLKVYRKRVEPSGPQTEIFSETFTGTSGTDYYPVSVSSIILADDRSKFYFTLEFFSESDTQSGKTELCQIAKDGTGNRVVLKVYNNPHVAARSPVKSGSDYYYLEGGWFRLPSDDEDVPDKFHYPNEGGHLIEIESNGDITDHGIVWRSAQKADSPDPDPENPQHDGWGRHNAVVGNIVVDSRGNLRFVAGYGLPYRISNNLPSADVALAIPDESNFNWIQFGQDLATKIASFPTNGRRGWDLIQQLAELMLWEIGFGPGESKVAAVQARDSNISDWSANASLFFRPRTIKAGRLIAGIGASGSASVVQIDVSDLVSTDVEFPTPPADQSYRIIIDKEIFSYTRAFRPSPGVVLLSGVNRGQDGSTAAAHSVGAAVYFVDYFASGETGTTLVSIQNRSQDFVNVRNDVNVAFGDRIHNAKDQTSIDEHSEKTFNLGTSQPLLSRRDKAWAELIGDAYLNEFKDIKEVLQFTLVCSPTLQPGQLILVYQLDRVRIAFKRFRIAQVQHHTFPRWQTQVTALEIL